MRPGEHYRLPNGVAVTVAEPPALGVPMVWELVGPFGARWAVDAFGGIARIEPGRRGGSVLRSTGWLTADLTRGVNDGRQ